ncbi:MAG: hypothetical protein OD814_000490 [Candidatus Alkanophagales archaeon MCA70_species_1]|nr:hypothetical protein [Candidatus Alkanophaga volatiphilum]
MVGKAEEASREDLPGEHCSQKCRKHAGKSVFKHFSCNEINGNYGERPENRRVESGYGFNAPLSERHIRIAKA